MPGSAVEGKSMVRDFCVANDVRYVLDVGPGEGTYFYALEGAGIYRLDGVEIFPPYIDTYGLKDKYNTLFISDIYDFKYSQQYDMVILGDVIEHMVEERGRKVIADAVANARFVVVSLPIYGYEQGPACGNIYEAHLEQYTNERILNVLSDYEVLEQMQGQIVGVYIFKQKS